METETQDSNPLSGDIEEAILDDLDAQLEDECLERKVSGRFNLNQPI